MIPGSANPLLLAGAAEAPAAFKIDRSLRFNDDDSAYLNRDLSSGSTTTWTFSAWVKKTLITTSTDYRGIFTARSATNNYAYLDFSDNAIRFANRPPSGTVAVLQTTPVFRDASAWFHVVFVYDSSNSTSTDTLRLYINGTRVTAFSTATYPSASQASIINSGIAHYIGYDSQNTAFVDGYLADVHFIDGQALAPTDFGEYDSNNVWNPIEYTGTYEFTPTVEVGSPSYPSDFTSTGNKTSDQTALSFTSWSGSYLGAQTKIFKTSDTSAFDLTISLSGGTNDRYLWYSNNATDWTYVGNIAGLGNPYTLSGYKYYATSEGSGSTTMSATAVTQGVNSFHLPFSDNSSVTALGYDAAATQPALAPKGGMDVALWTGDGVQRNIPVGFSPDLVWIKCRDVGAYHVLQDSVRGFGSGKNLTPNLTAAEGSDNDGIVVSADSTGFVVSGGQSSGVNRSGYGGYVAWCWKAGGTAVSNTDGTITSSVSANTDYGFSIVSYTGSGSNATIGHGLGATPAFVIVKNRSSAVDWVCNHQDLSSRTQHYLILNSSSAETSTTGYWNTGFNSTTFGVGNAYGGVNASGNNYIAYCWSEVSGFSKFGSYTGNGSATGPVVTTGFKPRFLLIKNTSISSNWFIFDSERSPSNPITLNLKPNTSAAEETDASGTVKFTSDGFQILSSGTYPNGNGNTIIYAAFADRPGNDWTPNNLSVVEGVNYSKDLTGNQTFAYPASNAFNGNQPSSGADSSNYAQLQNSSGVITFAPSNPVAVSSTVAGWVSQGGYLEFNGQTSSTAGAGGGVVTITVSSSTSISSTNSLVVKNTTYATNLGTVVVDGSMLVDQSGVDNDSLIDTPTNYEAASGNNGGNYATFNAIEPSTSGTKTLTNGNLEAYLANANAARLTIPPVQASGKFQWEITLGSKTATYYQIGMNLIPMVYASGDLHLTFRSDGNLSNTLSGSWSGSGVSYTQGDVITVTFDNSTNEISFYKNGSYTAKFTLSSTTTEGLNFGVFYGGSGGTNYTLNAGQRPFAYPVSGFKSLCTTNLADPTIADGSQYFDAKLYTGNGSTQTISGLGFSPDLVWLKRRDTAQDHNLYDSVRGSSGGYIKQLLTNTTSAESPYGDGVYGGVTSLTADGFSLGSSNADYRLTNASSSPYVGWAWDGGTSTVSNTDGSITSSVRANQSAGFSIVSYTSTVSDTGTATIGHGLNVTPSLVIIKNRDWASSSQGWPTWHSSLGGKSLYLDATAASSSTEFSYFFNNTQPTSTVFSVSSNAAVSAANRYRSYGGFDNFVAYCFAPVEGYSAFGSFVSNNSTDNVFIYTGFRVRWIMWKRTSSTGGWFIYDAARNTSNPVSSFLEVNSSSTESDASPAPLDFVSNGFKVRNTLAGTGTFIYACFASHPFKTARAR